ncbi:MAG: aminoglycoside phosphotransferase [Frankiales bacterium]|nr:aminoglycoside phosphotransferase [Frankiales bacterium]
MAAGRRDELYAQATALPPSVAEPVLAHGDLHLRHLFVSADGAATAVIDWDDTYRADPALDLMLVYGGFVGAARTAFLETYGPISREQERRARVLPVGVCAALAASVANGAVLQREALRGLVRSVS